MKSSKVGLVVVIENPLSTERASLLPAVAAVVGQVGQKRTAPPAPARDVRAGYGAAPGAQPVQPAHRVAALVLLRHLLSTALFPHVRKSSCESCQTMIGPGPGPPG
jgi:hypothetical protein